MPPEEPERFYPLICEAALYLILGIGVTIALVLAVLPQLKKRGGGALPAVGMLQRRPFTILHTVPVLALTGLLALLNTLQVSGEGKAITPTALILGMSWKTVMDCLVIALCLWLVRRDPRAAFGLTTCTWQTAVGKGFLYGFAAVPIVTLVSYSVATLGKVFDLDMAPQEIFDWLNDPSLSLSVRVTLIVFVVVVAPITEELLFRGILLPVLMKGRAFLFAALLSSFYFSLIHLHGPSFLSLIVLSVMFSAGYAATGSILTPIIMHTIFNLTGVLFFFAGSGG
ncbi:MAG: CPBP family intramembrane metalloprotease [Kiritimatiellaeota bacterium]|nr:CPBP family intramembrane metalloprotease [Kiritimatiellota bacterium]